MARRGCACVCRQAQARPYRVGVKRGLVATVGRSMLRAYKGRRRVWGRGQIRGAGAPRYRGEGADAGDFELCQENGERHSGEDGKMEGRAGGGA